MGGCGAMFALFAAHLVEARAEGEDLVAQRVGRRRAARRRRRFDGRRQGPRPFCGFRRGAGRARVEFAAPAGDLRDGVLHVDARTLGRARRFAPPVLDGLDAARERGHTRFEFAFGLFGARFQAARRVGGRGLLAGGAVVDRIELFGDGLKRRPFLAAIGLAAFDPPRDRFECARRARFRAFGAAFELGDRPPRAIRRRGAPRLGSEPGCPTCGAVRCADEGASLRPTVLAARKARNALADRIEPVVAFEFGGFDALFGGFVGDDFVEPIAQAHAGASGCLFGERARLAPYASDVPSRRAVHGCNRRRGCADRSAFG